MKIYTILINPLKKYSQNRKYSHELLEKYTRNRNNVSSKKINSLNQCKLVHTILLKMKAKKLLILKKALQDFFIVIIPKIQLKKILVSSIISLSRSPILLAD